MRFVVAVLGWVAAISLARSVPRLLALRNYGQLEDELTKMLVSESSLQRRNELLERGIDMWAQAISDRNRQLTYYAAELEKRNADLTASNRELDDFAYVASHDLKEPLRGIHNYATFLIEDYRDRLDADGREKLATLQRLTQRMEQLIDSLLQFSRVGRVDLAIEETNLNDIVRDVLLSLSIMLTEHQTKIRIEELLPTIRCDRVRVREVFQNLITNAIKYNDKAERWIEIGCLPAEAQTNLLRRRDAAHAQVASHFKSEKTAAVAAGTVRSHANGAAHFPGGAGGGSAPKPGGSRFNEDESMHDSSVDLAPVPKIPPPAEPGEVKSRPDGVPSPAASRSTILRASASKSPVFYVRDNGIGIREKHFEAVFGIFKRLHSRDKFGGGTGAGLTIVKKIVERHGGQIWVDSEFGEGTTFYFTLGSTSYAPAEQQPHPAR
jgi:signal transduction histidine kinase